MKISFSWFRDPWHLATLSCFLPLLGLFIDIALNNLGGNPIQTLHIRLGDWSLRFLWVTLAITPIQTISGWKGMADYRQLFGLCSFGYASLHLLVYLWVDHGWLWDLIWPDILESSYIWFGIGCYLILLPLAISSPKYGKRLLGKNWKKLHRWIYLASILAILHYFWQLKANLAEPLLYSLILGLLLLFRLSIWLKNKYLFYLMIPKGKPD
jgi:methionine sulfoxide reductase heme-binding subunit